jgi:hypothetical protein
MAFLENFSQAERDLLVSLPYRAGLWVSASDASGGHAADQKELDALERTIARIAHGMFESAFVHEVMAETFLRKAEWPGWAENTKTVLDDCQAVIKIINNHLPPRDADAYRHILMQIGLEVARAFREYTTNAPFAARFFRGISVMIDRLFGIVQGEKFVSETVLNVSYEEDLALNALAKALRGDADTAVNSIGLIVNS